MHVTTKLTVRTNLFFFYRHTINAIDNGYNSNSFNYRININAAYQFKHDFAAEFFGNFNSARNEAQGKYPSFTRYSIALRKQIWNKKGSIALTATNPFNQYVNQRTSLFGPNLPSIACVKFRSVPLVSISRGNSVSSNLKKKKRRTGMSMQTMDSNYHHFAIRKFIRGKTTIHFHSFFITILYRSTQTKKK